MKVLLDECVNPAFARCFRVHQATSVLEAGLLSLSNGELIRAAESEFDAFITVDKGIVYQQNLQGFKLVIVLLRIGSNRADKLEPFVDEIEANLGLAKPGAILVVESGNR